MDPAVAAQVPGFAPEASTIGPKIFQLSPLPGNIYEVDRFYYAPSADITEGGFMALIAFASMHGHPITIHDCPNIAAFQVIFPSAIVRPFWEVPPAILRWGRDILSEAAATAAAANTSAALSPTLLLGAVGGLRGADPPPVNDPPFRAPPAQATTAATPDASVSSSSLLLLGFVGGLRGADPPPVKAFQFRAPSAQAVSSVSHPGFFSASSFSWGSPSSPFTST
jgi:hypothetical protein